MDAEAAARAWIDGWSRGWRAHNPEPIAALYIEDVVFVSEPFRAPTHPRDYAVQAFAEEDEVEFRFGEPIVCGDRAVVEYWAYITFEGKESTLAGVALLRFDQEGRCVDQRDYWSMKEGRHAPSPHWGR